MRLIALLLSCGSPGRAAESDAWARVREVLEFQPFVPNVAIVVGNESRVFHHEGGRMTLDRQMWVASSSKMVFAVRAMQMVEQELIGINDTVSMHLPYWTINPRDPRSKVTLLHLLSFQSGYTFSLKKADSCWLRPWLNFSACVERLYHTLPLDAEPGTVWDYNEFHLQVVAAVLEKVLGQGIGAILSQDLAAWNMTHSSYLNHEGPGGPDVAADMVTTGEDYEQFMIRYFTGRLLLRSTSNFMEEDLTPAKCTLDTCAMATWEGHYGIGNWYYCFNDFPSLMQPTRLHPLPARCRDAQIHADMGFFGVWPIWDRRLGYWMIIVADGLPGLGDFASDALVHYLKPFVDAAIAPDQAAAAPDMPTDAELQQLRASMQAAARHRGSLAGDLLLQPAVVV